MQDSCVIGDAIVFRLKVREMIFLLFVCGQIVHRCINNRIIKAAKRGKCDERQVGRRKFTKLQYNFREKYDI
jgi:hypothetical protein